MADFYSNQAALAAARAALDKAQLTALRAEARAQQAQSALHVGRRQAAHAGRKRGDLDQLAVAAKQREAERGDAKAAVRQARAALLDVHQRFSDFSDPRKNVERLGDDSPFLLFPVRIETRFRIVSQAPARIANIQQKSQLWVRIYPDDCSIDTFEPLFSGAELANVKNYWLNIWRAGGLENDERGAWARLVTAHGSGRAGWMIDHFEPTNAAAKPAKIEATDVILVVPATAAPSAADAAAITSYWKAVWLADGDPAKIATARASLNASVGAAHADELISALAPFNMSDKPAPPLTRAGVRLSTAFVIFPPDPDTTLHSWTQAPKVRQFPDRFLVLGYSNDKLTLEAMGAPVVSPLYVGPDPSADPGETIHPSGADHKGPDLVVPDELKWMVDFETAVAAGMALAIDLEPEQVAAGFDLLLVIGLQLSTPATAGPAALEELLSHHQIGRSGFALLPQGTPAHNSTAAGSGHTRIDDPDATFDDRRNLPLFTPVADPAQKRDGQWLAEFLGLDTSFLAAVHGSGGVDQMQARAMQTSLWPATLGYWMNTLFTPNNAKASIFSDQTIELTRLFYTQFVSGRGPLPAVRIGGQPYGILPTTAFSRIRWYDSQLRLGGFEQQFLGNLYRILRQIDADWETMGRQAHWVGEGGDPHQTLLNVVAHHPSSVEYYSRTAESLGLLFNMLNLWALAPQWWQALLSLNLQAQAVALLNKLGYTGTDLPDLLNHFFLNDNPRITTVIDDRPLSEKDPIRPYSVAGDDYIQWMIKNAGSLETLRAETGFIDNKSPQALLYLYLRHALMLGYYDSSYNFHRNLGLLDAPALLAMRVEPTFIHVAESAGASESRFGVLYKPEKAITGNATQFIHEFIGARIGVLAETEVLASQVNGLKLLATASTAQLERLFAEHIDTCSYRYDSWLLGLVNQRLIEQRRVAGAQNQAGLYLGAYAWVENLKPAAPLAAAQIPAELAKQFPGDQPLMTDPAGGGYIHAPSIQHADTAAVLRSGYLANAGQGNPDTLAINLSSDRVRVALTLIEGIRNGQSLGALLGYRFERGLHDAHGAVEVDKFIYPLRKAFPLVADSLSATKTDPNVPIEAIEARNVLDGKKLLDQVQKSGKKQYPYGLTSSSLPGANAAELKALNEETNALLDAYDAVADLALAEGVHQAVQGNYDRVASTIEAYTTGNFPPEPAVAETPPLGISLTHRFAVQFKPGLAAPAGATPRAQAEPAIDEWLSRTLPSLDSIACTVAWTDPATGTPQQHPVTLKDLGLHPLDLIFLLKPDNVQAMAELDDRVLRFAISKWKPRWDAVLQVQYMIAGAKPISIFEAGPLLRELRALVTQSRPLRASDVRRSNDAASDDNRQVFADDARISVPLGDLGALGTDIDSFLATQKPLLSDTKLNRAAIIASVDTTLGKAVALLERAARFALPSSGWGFAYRWMQEIFVDLLSQLSELVVRWTKKLSDFDKALLDYLGLPPATTGAERFAALQAAELLIRSSLDPLPAKPGDLLLALGPLRTAFENRLKDFNLVLKNPGTSFSGLFNSLSALSTAEFDSQPFDLTSFGDRAVTVTEDIFRILTGQSSTVAARAKQVQDQLNLAAAAKSAAERVQAIQVAAKRLLGDDFQILPEFTVSSGQGSEWAGAYAASQSGELLKYLLNDLKIDFPVEEWFYGAARVRPMLHSWETASMLQEAFGVTAQSLTPLQLPFQANDSWLALEYPDDYAIDSDRLLYTCAYSVVFDPNARQCGLLIDEWTEVIPIQQRDTAVTFNYPRPDNEPPQAMLLVTAASNTGSWQWDDIVGALRETLQLAKKRAVEPAFLDPTVYSRFLPATVMASTSYAITIATPLVAANSVIDIMQEKKNA